MKTLRTLIASLFFVIFISGAIAKDNTIVDYIRKNRIEESYIDYPANYRLLMMPTAFTPGVRTFVISNREIMNFELAYGVGNRGSISAGFMLIPVYAGIANIYAKYRFADFWHDRIHLAAYGSVWGAAGFGAYTGPEPPENQDELEEFWGVPSATDHYFTGGVISFGNEYHNLSMSASVKLSPYTDNFYVFSMGGSLSLIKGVKAIAEYNYIDDGLYHPGFGGFAMRYYTDMLLIDGGVAILDDSIVPFIQLAITPQIGKNR